MGERLTALTRLERFQVASVLLLIQGRLGMGQDPGAIPSQNVC
jgi:hypothetical protein